MELIIGCVGKPSAGKSTFFNAVTDGKAKVGNFPFTTIEPNEGITYYLTGCACATKNLSNRCRPRYGKCENGVRHIPVKLLDVAGLIPGASEGAGLGNKFLDNLRSAHILMHIIDVSGLTNEKGEETIGYDPINDADWLVSELHNWVFNNLWRHWSSVARRHVATKSSLQTTLVAQLSGYGVTPTFISTLIESMEIKEPCDLASWDEDQVHKLVKHFLDHRFKMVLVLNKADQGDKTDKNIERIAEKYGSERCFVASAAAECFLRNAAKQNFIRYEPGSMFYSTAADDDNDQGDAKKPPLKPLEKKIGKRLERVSDMVLFRFGSTGVRAAINAAVELSDMIVVYPVRSVKTFTSIGRDGSGSSTDGSGVASVFGDAMLVRRGCTVKDVAMKFSSFVGNNLQYTEAEDGRRLADDETLTNPITILRFVTPTSSSANSQN